jgi:hypothetical protein
MAKSDGKPPNNRSALAKDTVRATGSAVAQGVELATMVGATATEALRARRDPAVVAEKRVRAARRRVTAWSAGAVLSSAFVATGAAMIAEDGAEAGAIGAMVLFLALLVWCIVGIVRAAADLRARKRVVVELPAAAPARPAVAGQIRPEMARLDSYSDGLRQLVGMIGIVEDDPSLRQLRDEILVAADASEARLRRQAMDLTGLLKAKRNAPPDAAAQLDATATMLHGQIHDGVANYGELVSAASDAVVASRNLASSNGSYAGGVSLTKSDAQPGTLHPELGQPIDQLRSLAAGMRELTQG